MNDRTRTNRSALLVIMLALAAWGAYHTIGVFRSELVKSEPDISKAVIKAAIVFVAMAAFLAFWGLLLFVRKRKENSQGKSQPSCPPSTKSPSDRI